MGQPRVKGIGRLGTFGLGGWAAVRPRRLGDYPRLPRGVVTYPNGSGVVLRSVLGAVEVGENDRDWFLRVIGKLDGKTPLSQILHGEQPVMTLKAMRHLADLAESGILADGPAGLPVKQRARNLSGVRVVSISSGKLSQQFVGHLRELGVDAEDGDLVGAATTGAVALYAPDQLAPSAWEALARNWRALGGALVAVLPFGDAALVSPRFEGSGGPCLACLEKAWLGLSPAIALERRFLERLTNGEHLPAFDLTENETERIVPLLADRLSESANAAAMTIFDIETGESATTRLYSHPECPVCAHETPENPAGLRHEALRNEAPPTSLERLQATVAPLAGLPSGIAAVLPVPARFPEPLGGLPHIAVARYAVADPAIVTGAQANYCHGSGKSALEAETMAVIEGAERFAGLARPAGSILAAYDDFREHALLPTDLPLFSYRQYATPGFRFRPFDPSATYRWIEGWNLTHDTAVWVPLSAVSYGYDDELLAESSSGIAAHSQRSAALVNACLELVERDAFMIHWLNRLPPLQIDLGGFTDRGVDVMLRHVRRTGSEVHLLDITTDLGVPVCLALGVHREGRRPALTVGAGAAFDMQTAVERAVRELYAGSLGPGRDWTLGNPMALEEVRSLEDNGRAYAHPYWLRHAEFLWASRGDALKSRAVEPGANPLFALVTRLAENGHDLIAVDLTPRALAGSGLTVVRTIAPGLQPLALGARPRLGGRRAFEAPVRMGRLTAPLTEGTLNPLPHCFP